MGPKGPGLGAGLDLAPKALGAKSLGAGRESKDLALALVPSGPVPGPGRPRLVPPGRQGSLGHQKFHNYTPHIIYPTRSEVTSNRLGPAAGLAIHFNHTRNKTAASQYHQNIKPYLCKWNPGNDVTGRETTPPHVKLYMSDNGDNWRSLKWVFLGSHNLSKQAWGGGKGFGGWYDIEEYEVSSWELGVLVTREGGLHPVYKSDFSLEPGPVRLPFELPPTKYGDEEPWSMENL